jgi:hypothetical protein
LHNSGGIHFAHAVIAGVGYVDVSLVVQGQTLGIAQLRIERGNAVSHQATARHSLDGVSGLAEGRDCVEQDKDEGTGLRHLRISAMSFKKISPGKFLA